MKANGSALLETESTVTRHEKGAKLNPQPAPCLRWAIRLSVVALALQPSRRRHIRPLRKWRKFFFNLCDGSSLRVEKFKFIRRYVGVFIGIPCLKVAPYSAKQ